MGTKVIDYQFKLLYALGIILVVAGHCRNGGVSLFYDWFQPYAFHLKLFMFASGYFYSEHNEYCPVRFIWKKFKRLIIPCFLWNLVYGIFTMITKYYGGFTIGANISLKNLFVIPLQSGAPFAYNMGGWFLIPLFIVHIYNLFMRIVIKKIFGGGINEYWLFAFDMILGVTGVYMAVAGIRGGWLDTLDKSLIFIPFYQAGILYKRELKERDQINTPVYLAFIGIIALVLIYYWGMVPAKGIAILSNFKMYMTYTLFLSAFLGIAFWLRLSRILAPAIGKSYYVNLIADNTWSIMMHEFIGFMLVKYIFYLLYLYTPFCHTFDATKFHHDIFYYYLPNNRYQMLILYMIAGVVIPLLIHSVVRRLQLKLIGTRWGKSFGSL